MKNLLTDLIYRNCPNCKTLKKGYEATITAICSVHAKEMRKLKVPVKVVETRYVYTKNREEMIKRIGRKSFDELMKLSE